MMMMNEQVLEMNMGLNGGGGSRQCRNWQNTGRCEHGNNCRFFHDRSAPGGRRRNNNNRRNNGGGHGEDWDD